MRLKRLISCLLSAALLAGLLVFPPASASGSGGFSDISDSTVADAAEMLRLLGVVDGTGVGAFNPGGTLSRAEFCKMTVEIMGRGAEEPAQRNRTIFTDVGPTYWARGYVNLASSITIGGTAGENGGTTGGTRLIMGVGDGTFRPNQAITYGEAVTILMRVLGYGSADVATGSNWYDGYVAVAQSSGLADGLSLGGAATLTRGQAAILFYNLLFTEPKDSDQVYLTTLGGSLEDNVIVLSTDATAADGTTGSVLTTSDTSGTYTYKTDRVFFSNELNGTRGQLVLDKNKKLLAVLPDEGSTFRSVTVMGSPEANAIPVLGDETISVTLKTPVYTSDEQAASTTYEDIWTSLRSGASLRLCFNSSGKLEYIYMPSKTASVSDDNVLVAKNKPTGSNNPFASLSGGKTPAQIYKNGIPAELSDLRQYDVGTYDKSSDTLFVSDLKLSGLYENAYPNAAAPSTVTVMGAELTVLPSAQADLAAFKVGDKVTLLLTTTGQVAGAVSPDVAKSNAVGVAEVKGTTATIKLLDGILTLEGQTTYSEAAAAKLNGCLVTVSSYKRGYLTLSKVNGKGASTALNLTTNRMGTKELSAGARFFEQVSNGRLVEIDRSDITITSIPANKITYVGYDWAGRVDKLVLNDVTGDRYDYGMIYYRAAGYEESKDDGSEGSYQNGEIRVTNGSHTDGVSYVVGSVDGAKTNRMGGVAGSLDQLDGKNRMAAFMPLNEATGIRRAQFDTDAMLLTTNSMVIPISDKVECYNKTTGDWFKPGEDGDHKAALNLALAFSDDITVYYDRSPEEGGKVRIVVVE